MRIGRLASITLVLVCTLLIAVPAQAQTGSIDGTIVAEGSLLPLGTDSTTGAGVLVSPASNLGHNIGASTDANGHYVVPNLAPGTYYVRAFATDRFAKLYDNLTCIAEDCPLTSGTPVVVTAGATATANFALAKAGIIKGTVRRAADGSPVGNVLVELYNANTSRLKTISPEFLVTSGDGTYILRALPPGTYFGRTLFRSGGPTDVVHELYGGVPCHYLAPASDCRIASSAPITVVADTETVADFSLDKAATISGTVAAEGTGTPLANVRVTAYVGTVALGSAVTNSSGQYTIPGLRADRYRVRTDAAPTNYVDEWHNGACLSCPGARTTLTIGVGDALADVDFSLATGGTITGTLSCSEGQNGTMPSVDAFDSTGHLIRTLVPPPILMPGWTIQCDGATPPSYTLAGLPTGQYFLLVRDTPFINSVKPAQSASTYVDQLYGGAVCITADCDVRKGAPVSVAAGATTAGINFVLRRGGGFNVTTTNQQTSLKFYDARGVEVVRAMGPHDGLFGFFPVAGLPPGAYYATINGRLNGVPCVDCPPTAGHPIVVNPNLSVTGAVSFAPFPLRKVSGTVTKAVGGAPLSTVTVELVTGSGTVAGRALSDLNGRYTIDNLFGGTYYARTVNDFGFVDEVYPDAAACGTCDPRGGTPIVVPAETDVTGIDFGLTSGGVLSGTVTDTAGIALDNVPVSIYGGSSTFAGVKTTNATGRYHVTLPAATYTAIAEETSSNNAEIYADLPCTSAACDPATGVPIPLTTGNITGGINFTLGSCSAMSLSPTILATALVGSSYRQVFSAVGGTGPYAFDVTDGSLPLGLALDASTGVLSGAPTLAGRSMFRVSVLDATGCAADRTYALEVQACAFTLSPASATLAAAGGSVTITIANGCGAQDVAENASWIAVQANTPGQVTLAIDANTQTSARTTTVTIGRRAFEVRQAAVGSQAPFGALDLPTEGAQVSGAVAIGGWALDDVEVTRVRIYRDAAPGEPAGLIFVGTAVVIPGARPDVQATFPSAPRNDRAGFGFLMLTNTLPNQGTGTFRIHAIAEDAEGHSTALGVRTIVGNNATSQMPFGTIDTPLQGQTIAGSSYVNFGWALTPQPAMIPTNGSTIQVILDGAPIGTVDYNHFRPDVSNTFTGLANSGGPVGFRIFDTTALTEGLHTISWTVTDTRPATAGLGSRYFTVANSADAPPPSAGSVSATQTTQEAVDVATPLGAAPAPDHGRRVESLATAKDVAYRLTLAPMQRLELPLDALLGPTENACAATWAGYLLRDNALTDLPVGASLDPAGTFYWQTGPGFAGQFSLVFVRTNCRGEKQHVPVTVRIPIR